MTEPRHDRGHALNPQPFGQTWPRDHDYGQTEHPGCVDLGARATSCGSAAYNLAAADREKRD